VLTVLTSFHRSAIIEVHQTRLLAVAQVVAVAIILCGLRVSARIVFGTDSMSLFPTNELAHRQLANRRAMKVGLDNVESLQRGSHELTCTKAQPSKARMSA
jgi:hypothetical protein